MATPTGTITFLFTDIEGSTTRWDQHGAAMRAAVERHDEILRGIFEQHGGFVFKTVGDAFCVAFSRAPDAVVASIAAQRALRDEPWDDQTGIWARMALHTGDADERDGDYFGPAVNRVARLLSAGHGGQTLLSLATAELVRDSLPDGVMLHDLGRHSLRDLSRPEQILQLMVPGIPGKFPALKTLDNRPHNLPLDSTAFIGREHELELVCDSLRRPDVRLLTLTGPGGAGKTRLALQAGAALLADLADGVFFVPLAPVADHTHVAAAIAAVLGLRESGGRPPEELVVHYLEGKQLLLILDNLEHLPDASPLVARLAQTGPHVTVLVTGRTPLRVSGEREFPVPTLGVPDARRLQSGMGPAGPQQLVEEVGGFDAVRLFVDRAQGVRPNFMLTADNAAAVAEICRRLDGLPLAIELAAARVQSLPPATILTRLSRRLDLLTGGARDLPERQQTLRGAIDWSFDLLRPAEQSLLSQLGVFVGGGTLEAVEAVCSQQQDIDVVDGLATLIEKSLLQMHESDDEPRYALLQTLREYALEQLAHTGEMEAVRDRHAAYFLSVAESSAAPRADQTARYGRLEIEHDNLREAQAWLGERGQAETALRLAVALWEFWYWHGHLSEGRRRIERGLAAAGADAEPALRIRAMIALGALLQVQGERVVAGGTLEEALSTARDLGDRESTASALHYLGRAARYSGDYALATSRHEEALALYRELSSREGIAHSLANLGILARFQGDYDRAASLLVESLGIFRLLNAREGVGFALANLGTIARLQGNLDRATTLHTESLEVRRALGDKRGAAISLGNLAAIASAKGDHDRARSLFIESLSLDRDLGDKEGIAYCLEGLAAAMLGKGDAEGALKLWSAADRLRADGGYPLPPGERSAYETRLARARSQLGTEEADRAWQEGHAADLDELAGALLGR